MDPADFRSSGKKNGERDACFSGKRQQTGQSKQISLEINWGNWGSMGS
jgi:hypothetical protein